MYRASGVVPEALDHTQDMNNGYLRLIPLGGMGAIGKNMMALEYGEAILVIDAGLMFPDEDMLGIDLVLPDFSYIVENQDRVVGVVLTHGHEDHIGALPYLLNQVLLPVYGTRLTLGILNGKLGEHRLQGAADLNEISEARGLELGPFSLSFLPVCHSIPDGVGLAIRTPVGTVVHSGDFKLDQTPIDQRLTALHRFAELGEEGVLLFLSDSTNAEVPGVIPPELSVGETLDGIFSQAPGRVLVACFASHMHRVQQVIDLSARHGRSVAIVGRSMTRNVNIAENLGYVNIPDGLIIRAQQIGEVPDDCLTVICTGSQGEPMSALARMASRAHQWVQVNEHDTVVISARPVPGNERSVSRTVNRLLARGATVIQGPGAGVHVSGHAAQEELKLLLNLVRPRYFVPIHGEYRHQHNHARLAKETGVAADNIFIMENGQVLEVGPERANIAGKVQAGMILVDGLAMGEAGELVLRDRHHVATDGIIIVVVSLRTQDCGITGIPEVVFRGFAHGGSLEELVQDVQLELVDALHSDELRQIGDVSLLKEHIHEVTQKLLFQKTRRRPMILPIVVEV
jgi:ribonuclease J